MRSKIARTSAQNHRPKTRAITRREDAEKVLQAEAEKAKKAELLRVEFNNYFRNKLPNEIKALVFAYTVGNSGKETPAIIIGLRGDEDLYQLALKAFHLNNTFVVTPWNLRYLENDKVMLSSVWKTVINLEIKHHFMRTGRLNMYNMLNIPNNEHLYAYTPCIGCDFYILRLAINVRVLHLDFGDAYHCVLPGVERTCQLAMEKMPLERLVVTVSNIFGTYSCPALRRLVENINNATGETGRLLSVTTEPFSNGLIDVDWATESWFWVNTLRRKGNRLLWVEEEQIQTIDNMRFPRYGT